jgi:hypothetical protein
MDTLFQNIDSNFKLVKLVNGEDIICTITDGNPNTANSKIEIQHPLKMHVIPKISNKGSYGESLNLSHWVHPYTETHTFHIPTSSILLVAEVSPGLSKYYEYVLKQIDREDKVEEYTEDEIYDELLMDMDDTSTSVH